MARGASDPSSRASGRTPPARDISEQAMPLMGAASNGDADVAQALITAGADLPRRLPESELGRPDAAAGGWRPCLLPISSVAAPPPLTRARPATGASSSR
ncbi:ankyrin repeat domain-containing protein [Paraconexibacter antarcticus]|uniref:Ankyrin repeat domain-containing protein n=1 Tax=Paraconexibacter antarcticus TaxID=2949664 RepID=A0ABY5E1Y6_9ACTN|nr:ankyrin repeat domain-containing protein [Paraconexibacter antarcticus]UTI66849.1 ankyrin repeat domain-containing protein [Paraconexibacter antarcticus]